MLHNLILIIIISNTLDNAGRILLNSSFFHDVGIVDKSKYYVIGKDQQWEATVLTN